MFSWKSTVYIPTPNFSKFGEKVGVGIWVIDFQGNIFMRSGRFPNLQKEFLFSLRRNSALYDIPFQSYDQSKMSKNRYVFTLWP